MIGPLFKAEFDGHPVVTDVGHIKWKTPCNPDPGKVMLALVMMNPALILVLIWCIPAAVTVVTTVLRRGR